jgi:membrane protein implicated in regulation of membrane protease activity
MDLLTGIYLGCLGGGLVYAAVAALLGGHGDTDVGGHDFDIGGHDFDVGGHDMDVGGHDIGDSGAAHISPVSPLIIACFVAGFGAFGLVGRAMGVVGGLSALVGAAGGVAMGAVVFVLLAKVFYAAQASSEGRQIDMIGLAAEVITPIPPDRTGEIAYVLGGSRYTAAARTEAPLKKEIGRGSTVRIKRVVAGTVYIEPE